MNRLSMMFGLSLVLLGIAHAMGAESRDDKANEPRTITLSAIVTTSPQKGLQNVRDVLQQKGNSQEPEAADGYLRQLLSGSNGSSNVFLVDATTIHDALAASFNILVGSRSADTPATVNTAKPFRGSHWLVAYLGAGPSTPTWWTIESVELEKNKVILSYRPSKPSPATADVRPYYYWIPLGTLDPGTYELQLVNLDQKLVRLVRRVDVAGTE
jgi:hypothetical protein